MIINPTSLTITQLLGSQNEQYVIPAYQRRYSWGQQQVKDLWDDINILEGLDTHLLGTIVCLTGHHVAGINRLELVDGQQRLTTVSILLYCLLQRLKDEGEVSEAQDLERLLKSKALGGSLLPKIALDSLDAKQFALHSSGKFVEKIENQRLAKAFEFVSEQISKCDLEKVRTILYRLQNQATIIRLDVSEAKNAFKLFETINNRGLSLSPTDIIKNFILGNAARFGEANLQLAKEQWALLIGHLDGINTESFFRHYMMSLLRSRVTSSFVVEEFQSAFMKMVKEAEALPDRGWYCDVHTKVAEPDDVDDEVVLDLQNDDSIDDEDEKDRPAPIKKLSFEDFTKQIVSSAKIYREIVLACTQNQKLNRRLRNLRLIKSQQSYGFLMNLRTRGCSDQNFEVVLRLLESFMMRRHICRERTGENETVFAKLCTVDITNPLEEVKKTLREYYPNDAKFKEEFTAANFNSALIDRARYCLEQIEINGHGEFEELVPLGPDAIQVEHIIPQKIKTKKAKAQFGDWVTYLGESAEAKHHKYVGRIGNLSLFAGELNASASNNPYHRKVTAYKSSAIKITNSLPDVYPEFRFEQVEIRSKELANLAVKLWPAI